MAAISHMIISYAFREWNVLYFDSNLTEVCSYKGSIDNNPGSV